MAVAVGIAGIRARFRFKRQAGVGHLQTELAQHVVENVVVVIAQLAGRDLQRHVAVAQVVAGAGEQERIGAAHHGNRLRGGDHFDDLAAVVGRQQVAPAQQQAARQHQPCFATVVQRYAGAAFHPHVNRQRDAGGNRMRVVQALG
ncbi:hypothetical protein L1887_44144 [Cichorium endivia]|nr:hypothetical protein L1887_44144 [Cichorium endivia]